MGGFQGEAESETGAVTEGQTHGAGLRREIADGPGMLRVEGHHIANDARAGLPRVVGFCASQDQLAVDFSKVYRADDGDA